MKIKNLTKIYKGKYDTVKALNEMTLNFDTKGLVFIVGVSGSGKSTLMNMLSGIDKPTYGDVIVGGKSLYSKDTGELFGYRNSYVSLIFQEYNLIDDLDVYENIKLSLELLGDEDYSKVDKIIDKMDINEIKHSKVTEISTGQMQRVAIARALVKNSNILLADEPTGNLDKNNGDIVLKLLKEVSADHLVIVITHDDLAAHEFGDRIIEIEDGKILSDSKPLNEEKEEEDASFNEPIVTFKNQIRFTKSFIKKYFARSLTLFLLMLLIPLLGAILCGYGFFNVGVTYLKHEQKYGGEYVTLAQDKRGLDVYFDADEYTEVFNKYNGSNLIQVYNTCIYLSEDDDPFYRNTIDHVAIYQANTFDIEGDIPTSVNEIVITDYIAASLMHYLGEVPDTLKIFGYTYNIVGICNTNYEYYLQADLTNKFTLMNFEDNMYIYNAIIMDEFAYGDETDTSSYVRRTNFYKEKLTFEPENSDTVVTDLEVTFYREDAKSVDLFYTSVAGYPTITGKRAYFSTAMLDALGMSDYSSVIATFIPVITCYDRSRCTFNLQVGGIYQSDELEIILASGINEAFYKYAITKVGYGRLVVATEDVNYKKIVSKENVVNQSFVYASSLNESISSMRIAIFEVLFTIVVIMLVFSSFVNSFTLNSEKRKIGIEYSLGLSRKKIIVPYILELLTYIIIGFISSLVLAKFIYPLFMRGIIYTEEAANLEFSFYYISWASLLGWNVLIALIMITSLLLMIYRIMRKSPVEIIKDI